MKKINLCCDKKNKYFFEIIFQEVKKYYSDDEFIQCEKIDNDTIILQLLSDKKMIPADVDFLFNNLGMRCGISGKNYYMQIDEKIYNRFEYENFIKLAEENGIKFGIVKYILMFELTFPLSFWSLTKQKKIFQQIFQQQCQVLTAMLLNKGENGL